MLILLIDLTMLVKKKSVATCSLTTGGGKRLEADLFLPGDEGSTLLSEFGKLELWVAVGSAAFLIVAVPGLR